MRLGMNPQKKEKKIKLQFQHRIIIVVYIPSFSGYYKNTFQVFKLCLESIIATKNKSCAITVVNNASCNEVLLYINSEFKNKRIDSVINHEKNIGKIDAIIGAARGCREPLITMTDVDILFKLGWQENIENIFSTMKDVGSVSPIPLRKNIDYQTSSAFLKIILKKVKFNFEAIPENFEDHNKFLESINWKKEDNKKAKWPVIRYKNMMAILGSSHQVLTINRNILFTSVPIMPSLTLVGNLSEFTYVDKPINRAGGMRLSTYNNYAYHMGNSVENWMLETQKFNLKKSKQKQYITNLSLNLKINKDPNWLFNLKSRIASKIFKLIYKI